MSEISTFDCLPNELIIGLFVYLEPAETFRSFFDYNDRLRKLVKYYVKYNRRTLDNDIKRYSTLHSWYKHLNFNDGGVIFYMAPFKGEQPRYNFAPEVTDRHEIHWHIWQQEIPRLVDKRIEEISRKYPIKLNPLFYPTSIGDELLVGNGPEFIRQNYPEQFQRVETTLFQKTFNSYREARDFNKDAVEYLMGYIYNNEPTRLRDSIRQAANSIWNEIQALEDVNILKIKYVAEVREFRKKAKRRKN